MGIFTKRGKRSPDRGEADKTAPGLKAIKGLWDIETAKPEPERVEGVVSSDIYGTSRPPSTVPPRHRMRRPGR